MLSESFSMVLNAPEACQPTRVQYLRHNYGIFVCSSVHGFVRTTDLMINEGATQEVIGMRLDVKGDTRFEPASTRVLNFDFSFTCIDSSNGGGPQAVGELWMYAGRATTFRCCVINCIQACLGFLTFKCISCSSSVYS